MNEDSYWNGRLEDRLRREAEFEEKIYTDCDLCKEPILRGETCYTNEYEVFCEKCFNQFEEITA